MDRIHHLSYPLHLMEDYYSIFKNELTNYMIFKQLNLLMNNTTLLRRKQFLICMLCHGVDRQVVLVFNFVDLPSFPHGCKVFV